MHIPKKYVHDRMVLLLLSTNFFLFVVTTVFVVLKLVGASNDNYIAQYRPSLGRREADTQGGILDLIAFPVFSLFVLVLHTLLSIRSYAIQRHVANTVLALGTLLLILSLIVSNGLLLRLE